MAATGTFKGIGGRLWELRDNDRQDEAESVPQYPATGQTKVTNAADLTLPQLSLIFVSVVAALLPSVLGLGRTVLYVDPGSITEDTRATPPSSFRRLCDALAVAESEDTILLHPGRYDAAVERFPLQIEKAVTICSTGGPDETVFIGPPREAVFEVTAPGVEIRGIGIEHMGTGITVLADDVVITGNRIELLSSASNVGTCGVWLAGARRARVTENAFVNCGLALAGPRVGAADSDQPALTGLFEVGHDPEWFTTHVITGNTVNGRPLMYRVGAMGCLSGAGAGQVIIAGCSGVTISGLDISCASIGLQIAHCTEVRILDCNFHGNSLFGLYVAYSDGCSVMNVSATGNNHGLDVRASSGTELCSSIADGNEQGVFLSYTQGTLLFDGSVCDNGVGVFLGNCSSCALHGNSISANRLGIQAQHSEGLWIIRNQVTGNELSGIRLSPGSDRSTILDN
ncbi:MAG: NosD domain-containing protein, partial [Candidatus Thermoplasmatota archaeon]|nr:NosD domain-containing protein [Candidatus Thermoplasmatota archaeon]